MLLCIFSCVCKFSFVLGGKVGVELLGYIRRLYFHFQETNSLVSKPYLHVFPVTLKGWCLSVPCGPGCYETATKLAMAFPGPSMPFLPHLLKVLPPLLPPWLLQASPGCPANLAEEGTQKWLWLCELGYFSRSDHAVL